MPSRNAPAAGGRKRAVALDTPYLLCELLSRVRHIGGGRLRALRALKAPLASPAPQGIMMHSGHLSLP